MICICDDPSFLDSKLPLCFSYLVSLEQGFGGVVGVGHLWSKLLVVHFKEVVHTLGVVSIQVALEKSWGFKQIIYHLLSLCFQFIHNLRFLGDIWRPVVSGFQELFVIVSGLIHSHHWNWLTSPSGCEGLMFVSPPWRTIFITSQPQKQIEHWTNISIFKVTLRTNICKSI